MGDTRNMLRNGLKTAKNWRKYNPACYASSLLFSALLRHFRNTNGSMMANKWEESAVQRSQN